MHAACGVGGASRRPLSRQGELLSACVPRLQPHHERMAGFTEMRLLRLLRLLSLLKVERQMRGLTIIKKVLSAKISQLIVYAHHHYPCRKTRLCETHVRVAESKSCQSRRCPDSGDNNYSGNAAQTPAAMTVRVLVQVGVRCAGAGWVLRHGDVVPREQPRRQHGPPH